MCIRDRSSEALQFGEFDFAVMDMHAPVLGATVQAGHRLAGIEQAALVERCLDAVEGFQFRRRVLPVSYTHLDVYKRQGQGVVGTP